MNFSSHKHPATRSGSRSQASLFYANVPGFLHVEPVKPSDIDRVLPTLGPFEMAALLRLHEAWSHSSSNYIGSISIEFPGEWMLGTMPHVDDAGWTTNPSHRERDSNLSVVLQFEKEGHDFTGIAFLWDCKPLRGKWTIAWDLQLTYLHVHGDIRRTRSNSTIVSGY